MRLLAAVTGIRRVVVLAVGLPVVFRVLGHANVVHQDARHAHEVRVDRVLVHHPFHLHDHDAARVVRSLRERKHVVVEHLVLHADVAVRVTRGAAQDGAVQGECRVEQALLPAQHDQLDQFLGRACIEPAAVVARVHESVQANLRNHPRLLPGDRAEHLRHHALRPVVGLDLVGHRQCAQPRGGAPVPADDAPDHAFVAVPPRAADGPVALARGVEERQVARMAGVEETPLDRGGHALGVAGAGEPGGGQRPPVLHEGGRFCIGNEFHRRTILAVGTRERIGVSFPDNN